MQRELGFDPAMMGFILSGFFWTYAVMQLPFGWFADRVGPRISLAVAVVWWSTFTALTAAARGVGTLFGFRLLLGVGEAGAYPSMAKVAANWGWPPPSSTAAPKSALPSHCPLSPG